MSNNQDLNTFDVNLEQQLINNLPEHYRSYENVNELFHALGIYLDELRKSIDNIKYYNDWTGNQLENIIYLCEQYGLDLPRSLSREKREIILRDLITYYKRLGTRPSLKLLFKFIGWDVTIESVFINSDLESEAYIYPSDYYFGEDYIANDGTLRASLKDEAENVYENVRIYGEEYTSQQIEEQPFEVIRCPYIRVIIKGEDYNIFASDYVSEGNGLEYSYSDKEKFRIVQDLIEYFYDFGRPSNIAIIELSTRNQQTFDLNPSERFSSNPNIQKNPNEVLNIHNIHYDHFAYFDVDVDHWSHGYTLENITYGNYNDNIRITTDPEEQSIVREYSTETTGIQIHFPLRQITEIEFEGPESMNIDLEVSNEPQYKIMDGIDEEIEHHSSSSHSLFEKYTTIEKPQSVYLNNYFVGRININEQHSKKVSIRVNYKKPFLDEEAYR